MKRTLVIVLAVWAIVNLFGCGGAAEAPHAVDVLDGSPVVTDAQLAAVISLTNTLAPSPVDLTNYTVTVHDSVESSQAACTGDAGCTVIVAKTINVPWPVEYNGLDRATLNAISAAALAHEMGHVFYFEMTGDPDHNHHHAEWFDLNRIDSVCGRVYDAFNKAVLQ